MKTRFIVTPLVLFLLMATPLFSQVSLPHIFSDNMVLQRDQPVKVWGKAGNGEKVTVSFNGQNVSAKANRKGEWTVTLKPMAFGGPYQLVVEGKNKLVYENVLVGDVWLCSGQSNMEWTVKDTDHAAREIMSANYPMIRSFNVVKAMDFAPLDDVDGQWTITTPETVPDYSAVGYYFAREVYEATKIPIGIINSSWGGTDIETWTSMDSFNALDNHYMKRYEGVTVGNYDTFIQENRKKGELFMEAFRNDIGLSEKWYDPATNISSWKKIPVPGLWRTPELRDADGIVWMRYDVNIPEEASGDALLNLGKVDDDDFVWVNGTFIGETSGYNTPRSYTIPAGVLKKGTNTVVVKVVDGMGDGGIYGEPGELLIKTGSASYSLAGDWSYKESATNKQFDYVSLSPNMYPSLLYNAMIHPLLNYRIKGATWYQGENNAAAAYDYQTLFPNMILNWRDKWGYEFPFYWVQLANYMAKNEEPVESNWAELREAQTMTLSLPQTGQAVITDIGDAYDIHPRNKQDVGKRLAVIDLHMNHGKKDVEYSGPVFKEMRQDGNKLVISFDHADGGLILTSKYGYVEGFAIAGEDGVFHWAKGEVKDGKVIISSDKVAKPVSVRYSWADNPDVNLYNKAGLPAGPFRATLK